MKKSKKPLYENITISGLPGAGSSTLGKALANVLDWKYFSGGDFMRVYAIEKGFFKDQTKAHHDATIYGEDFDRQVDFGMRDTLKNQHHNILDSWLSGFFAQGIKNTLKILTICSEDAVRVDRIVNRDNLTVEQAKSHIFEREAKNNKKWSEIYKNEWQSWVVKRNIINNSKPIWFWYQELYDLTIDTYKHSREQTLKIALKTLGHDLKTVDYQQAFDYQDSP